MLYGVREQAIITGETDRRHRGHHPRPTDRSSGSSSTGPATGSSARKPEHIGTQDDRAGPPGPGADGIKGQIARADRSAGDQKSGAKDLPSRYWPARCRCVKIVEERQSGASLGKTRSGAGFRRHRGYGDGHPDHDRYYTQRPAGRVALVLRVFTLRGWPAGSHATLPGSRCSSCPRHFGGCNVLISSASGRSWPRKDGADAVQRVQARYAGDHRLEPDPC